MFAYCRFGVNNKLSLYRFTIILTLTLLLGSCSKGGNRLEQIKAKGELIVVTRNAATTYYESREGFMGVEYEIVKAFADSLGVSVRFVIKEDIADLFNAMNEGNVDIAAAGLTHTKKRGEKYTFGPTYQMVAQQLVCHRGGKRPKKLDELVGVSIRVPAHSSYVEQLKKIKEIHPEIQWQEVENTDTESLLEEVWSKSIDCTVADENIVAINRRYFPELSIQFNLSDPKPIAWLIAKKSGDLEEALEDWFSEFIESEKLDDIMHRYYGYIELFDYVETRAYQRKIVTHLPKYIKFFKEAAQHYKVSWTLLAAQAYQESHWRANAKSPTGVRGMMMLTQTTARELGIKNRLNPHSSIMGGAYYLNKLRKRLPVAITEPDRTWIALAAYNVGMGHIWDARKLARQLNKNPDRWKELAEVLPLLTKKKYYQNLKHGYARGYEPVSYVQSIRDYQDILEKNMKENSLWQ
ncbi:MAG: membrane-bound lytic murein transglycosylase MltF [Gammaproteobacteria bacterium]|nr:membrane-bound lytic murein transglycosylase MltF [Gammaproteobacteria bacterium]MCW8987412.1 membrane-bound lytic murein transglycosylase MltF [Gammaproteobacteria bacterium]MCW9032180.1 membrane-bound lytic murein transglycosylase MltF [Gammaproteobacteria bacterium]